MFRVFGGGPGACAVFGQAGDESAVRVSLSVSHRVGFDGDGPLPIDESFAQRNRIELGLDVLVEESIGWCRGGVDPEGVLCQPAPVAAHEPRGTGRFPKNLDHPRDGVKRVAVERAAAEGEPASDRQGAIFRNAEFARCDLHRGREAAVEIKVIDLFDRSARELESPVSGQVHGGRAVKLHARREEIAVVGFRAGMEEDEFFVGDAGLARGLLGADDQTGPHVDARVCVHAARVGKGDHGVVGSRRPDVPGGEGLSQPGVRVFSGHGVEARPEFGDAILVGFQGFAVRKPDRALGEGKDVGGAVHPPGQFGFVKDRLRFGDRPVWLTGSLGLLQRDSPALRLGLAPPVLGASHEHDRALSALDRARRLKDTGLGVVAAVGSADGLLHGGPEAPCQFPARVGVAPGSAEYVERRGLL